MILCEKIFDNLDIYQSCFFNVLKRLKEKQKKKKRIFRLHERKRWFYFGIKIRKLKKLRKRFKTFKRRRFKLILWNY